jgi:hypothetical protein
VLGNDFKDAMRTYSTALLEFDRFVATYRNEAPVRDAALAIVSSEYGEEAMLQLARGDVDENLDFALMDLSDKVEGVVSKEVQAVIHSEPPRFYRRLFSSSQATLSSVFMFA